jgi:murein tripeptide amidase MpaA
MQARVAELVAMVRAERPVHERNNPWEVPVAEFELELQPLTTEQVLERLVEVAGAAAAAGSRADPHGHPAQ